MLQRESETKNNNAEQSDADKADQVIADNDAYEKRQLQGATLSKDDVEVLPMNLLIRIGKEGRTLPPMYRGRTFHRTVLFGNDPDMQEQVDPTGTSKIYTFEKWPGELGIPHFYPHERYGARFMTEIYVLNEGNYEFCVTTKGAFRYIVSFRGDP